MPTQSQYCLLTPHRTMAERYHKMGSNNSTLVLPFLLPSVHSASRQSQFRWATILPSLNSSATSKLASTRWRRASTQNGAASVPTHSSNATRLRSAISRFFKYFHWSGLLPVLDRPRVTVQPLESRPVCLSSPPGTAAARARFRRTSLPLSCVSDGAFVSNGSVCPMSTLSSRAALRSAAGSPALVPPLSPSAGAGP